MNILRLKPSSKQYREMPGTGKQVRQKASMPKCALRIQTAVTPHPPFFTSCSTGGGKATSTDTWGGPGGSASGSFSSSSSLCPFSWPSAGTTCQDSRRQRWSVTTLPYSLQTRAPKDSSSINLTHSFHRGRLFSVNSQLLFYMCFETGSMESWLF